MQLVVASSEQSFYGGRKRDRAGPVACVQRVGVRKTPSWEGTGLRAGHRGPGQGQKRGLLKEV